MLRTRPPGYEIHVDGDGLDLLEFERLIAEARTKELEDSVELRAQALALWRGPLLDDVVLEGRERSSVARLTELRLATQIERIDAELALGRAATLVGELESLAAANPYQERLHAQLMLALYRSGRQADALHVYQSVRRALSDELGLQPGPELRALEAAILRQDDALTLVASGAQTAPPERPAEAPPAPPRGRRRRTVVLTSALGVLAIVAVALLVARREEAPIAAPPNSVAVIDARTNELVDVVPVGVRPGPITAGGGFVWVGNLQDRNLSKIDPTERANVGIRLTRRPDADRPRLRSRCDLGRARQARQALARRSLSSARSRTRSTPPGEAPTPPTAASRSARAGCGRRSATRRSRASTRAPVASRAPRIAGAQPAGVTVGSRSVWVSNSDSSSVQRFELDDVRGGAARRG